MKNLFFCFLIAFMATTATAQTTQVGLDTLLPVRGFCIAAPRPTGLARFLTFVEKELAPRQVNTLILRVDFNYQYETHPELRDSLALSRKDVRKLVQVCRQHHIRLIPQVNLLGHQSWASKTNNLLRVYPQFDETPHIQVPKTYAWPNPDGLYCKSYCPLHPDVHRVVFELVDEVCDAFETDAFHAGLDEVFYLGDPKCPRCGGLDNAVLFAGEVRLLRDHLADRHRTLWMWGDRLLDGKTTGLGMWEASFNNTHRAIDLIPTDVQICDWHYERPDQTAVYFAMKGFKVVTCPWRMPTNAVVQVQDMLRFRAGATPVLKDRFQGVVETVWSDAEGFLTEFYGPPAPSTAAACFKAMFEEIGKVAALK